MNVISKRIAIALLTLPLALPLAAVAGDSGENRENYLQKRLDHLQTRLELSGEQVEALRGVFTEHHAAVKALHESLKDDMNAVLTDEQRKKHEQMREERREKMKERHHRKGDHKHDKHQGKRENKATPDEA